MLTTHAARRAAERLPAPLAGQCIAAAERFASTHPRDRAAVLVASLPRPIGGAAWGPDSNGDRVYAIVREGCVVTLMLRRSSQTLDPTRMGVDRIIR